MLQFQNATPLSIPEAFLVYISCDNITEFLDGIINRTYVCEITDQLLESNYAWVGGTLLFRHPKSTKTAMMGLHSQIVRLQDEHVVCITKIHSILWQENDDICKFLGVLEAKIRLKMMMTWRTVLRNDISYVAVPIQSVSITDEHLKMQLNFLKCVFGVNVVYPADGEDSPGKWTRRSLLLPKLLICTSVIEHEGLYCICTCQCNAWPIVCCSGDLENMLGLHPQDQQDLFEAFSQFHTAKELNRIKALFMQLHATSSVAS